MNPLVVLSLAFALTQLPGSIAAQKPQKKPLPTAAVNQYQIKPDLSVEVTPATPVVNRPALIRAVATPPTLPWRFEFSMDDAPMTECVATSPLCDWTPKVPGTRRLFVVARFTPQSGGRGGPGPQVVRKLVEVNVGPEPVPIPTVIPTPTPQLELRQISERVIAEQPARFAVSLTNAASSEYQINMGDGEFKPRSDAVFDHTFQRDGLVTIVVRYAGVDPPLEQSLTVNVEPRPQPTPSTTPEPPVQTTPIPQERDGQNSGGPDPEPPIWPYILIAGAIVAGALIVGRAITRSKGPVEPDTTPPPPPIPTFDPKLNFDPRFAPRKTGGVSLVVVYILNLERLRFSSTRTIRSEK